MPRDELIKQTRAMRRAEIVLQFSHHELKNRILVLMNLMDRRDLTGERSRPLAAFLTRINGALDAANAQWKHLDGVLDGDTDIQPLYDVFKIMHDNYLKALDEVNQSLVRFLPLAIEAAMDGVNRVRWQQAELLSHFARYTTSLATSSEPLQAMRGKINTRLLELKKNAPLIQSHIDEQARVIEEKLREVNKAIDLKKKQIKNYAADEVKEIDDSIRALNANIGETIGLLVQLRDQPLHVSAETESKITELQTHLAELRSEKAKKIEEKKPERLFIEHADRIIHYQSVELPQLLHRQKELKEHQEYLKMLSTVKSTGKETDKKMTSSPKSKSESFGEQVKEHLNRFRYITDRAKDVFLNFNPSGEIIDEQIIFVVSVLNNLFVKFSEFAPVEQKHFITDRSQPLFSAQFLFHYLVNQLGLFRASPEKFLENFQNERPDSVLFKMISSNSMQPLPIPKPSHVDPVPSEFRSPVPSPTGGSSDTKTSTKSAPSVDTLLSAPAAMPHAHSAPAATGPSAAAAAVAVTGHVTSAPTAVTPVQPGNFSALPTAASDVKSPHPKTFTSSQQIAGVVALKLGLKSTVEIAIDPMQGKMQIILQSKTGQKNTMDFSLDEGIAFLKNCGIQSTANVGRHVSANAIRFGLENLLIEFFNNHNETIARKLNFSKITVEFKGNQFKAHLYSLDQKDKKTIGLQEFIKLVGSNVDASVLAVFSEIEQSRASSLAPIRRKSTVGNTLEISRGLHVSPTNAGANANASASANASAAASPSAAAAASHPANWSEAKITGLTANATSSSGQQSTAPTSGVGSPGSSQQQSAGNASASHHAHSTQNKPRSGHSPIRRR